MFIQEFMLGAPAAGIESCFRVWLRAKQSV